jgi:ABC-type nitrate/sulfonate/bicarbonate transport system substrate-binding protein
MTFRRATNLLELAAVGALASCGHSPACGNPPATGGPSPTAATVRVRSASRSLPMLAAAARGFFQDENLTVDYTQFESSRPAFVQVSKHDIEVIISATDNAVNYRLNPHNAAGGILDIQIIDAHDNGLGLALVALRRITTAESVRGQRIGVDVPGSGFALTAAKIMRAHGLEAGADYTMEPAGSSPARLAGLLAHPPRWQAAIINAEAVIRARELGLSIIATVASTIHPYLGGVAASSRWWLESHPDVAERFIRAFHRGKVWVHDAANRAAAISLLLDSETTPALAAKIYDLNVAPDGLAMEKLDHQGLLDVLALRAEFGGFETPQDLEFLASPKSGLYDLRYYERATAALPLCRR